jgi:hypothetical protein
MGIGYLEEDRLKNIPTKHHAAHEFCFRLHDLMAHLVVEMSAIGKSGISFQPNSQEEVDMLNNGMHPLDFLATTGRGDLERRAAMNHAALAIFSDMLHFIFGGLTALEKRKFSVAFNLFRKPLKEGLLLVSWMCGDEEDFFAKLKSDPRTSFDPANVGPDRRKEILKAAVEQTKCAHLIPLDHLDSVIFDRKNDLGLAPLFDKSTHYITKNKAIATEDYNINMIFKNPEDNDVYEGCYRDIAYALFFLHMVQIEIYSRMEGAKNKYVNWLTYTAIAMFEILFKPGRSAMLQMTNRDFGEFLLCPHCETPFKVRKGEAARFFLVEMVECRECGMAHHFPFGWLLSKLDVDFRTDD